MANTVAGLAVSLGLNATDYVQGLNKAEYEAKKFANSFTREMNKTRAAAKTLGVEQEVKNAVSGFKKEVNTFRTALGALGIGLVVNEIYSIGKAIISTAAELNDFSDQTGSSVENLSKLSNQAEIAGTSFEELQGAVLKLSIGMGSAGEKGEKVDRVLKILGVTAKDPAEAMQQIAVAFAKYEDGATKAAYAQELFGKTGAKFLATLKDMANLQDVVATTTKKQAEEAEKLEQAYRRISVESTAFKNAILSDVVPALTRVISEFNAARQAGLGFWKALSMVGTGQVSIDERIENAGKELARLQKQLDQAKIVPLIGEESLVPLTRILINQSDVNEAKAHFDALRKMRSQLFDYSAFDKEKAGVLPGLGGGKAGGRAARTPADRISDAERYLANLDQQLQKTQDLSAEMTVLADIEAGRFKTENAAQTARALSLARQIDAAKAMEQAEKDRTKLAAEEARIREQTSKMKQDDLKALQAETLALAQGNEQLKQEIEAIGLDATSMAALTAKRLEDAAAAKEQQAAMYRNTVGMEAEAKALEDQARLLRERKGLLAQKGVAEQYAADMQKAKEINDAFADSFTEAAKSVIYGTKSIGDAVKNMGKRITDILLDMALNNIAKSLFGAPTSSGGGGVFGGIGAAIMGSIFGGGSSGGGEVFQFGRAYGGPVAAGQPYMVGERGPEMFIPKTAGTVVANNQLGQRGNYVFNINVPAGASRSTIDQTRVKFGLELQNALDRGS